MNIDQRTKSTWRSKLHELMSKALGIKEVYSDEVYSKRIKGQLGSEEEAPQLRKVVMAFDVSPSMSAGRVKQVIEEAQNYLSVVGSGKVKYELYFWGDSKVRYHRLTMSAKGPLVAKIASLYGPSAMGTDIVPLYHLMKKNSRQCDVYMIFTDGGLADSQSVKSDGGLS